MKKTISGILLVLILASILSGCLQKNKEISKDSQAGGKNTAENTVTYPITKDPITLRYWSAISANATPFINSYSENEAYQEMEKLTGIKIDFIHSTGKEQFNLMIASGDIPDLIQGAGTYKGGVSAGVNDGVYLDLTPYVKENAPAYMKVLNSDPEVKRQATSDDGKIHAFYRIKEKADIPFRKFITRKAWLEESGMQAPKTLADWENYFKFLKNSNKGDVPYTPGPKGYEVQFMGAFNVGSGFYLKDGKSVAYGQIQPQFKDYLTLMNKWYSYGYIPKNFPTIKDQNALQNFLNGKTAVIAADVTVVFTQAKTNNFEIETTPYPRVKDGDKLHWVSSPPNVNGLETTVSTSSKYKTEAIKWLNFGFTKEGSMLMNYGVEGKSWNMVDGKPKYTDYMLKHPKYPPNSAAHILRIHMAPKLTFSDFECFPPIIADGDESLNIRLKYSDDKDVDNAFVLPPIQLTAEELDKRQSIMEDINVYQDEMALKFITGAEPLSRYEEYVSYIKKLGIEEAIQITQNAYEKYMKK